MVEGLNWDLLLWITGGVLAVMSGLVTWIIVLSKQISKSDKDQIVLTLNKHEGWIIEQQKALNKLSQTTNTAIELIKQEQRLNQETLKFIMKRK